MRFRFIPIQLKNKRVLRRFLIGSLIVALAPMLFVIVVSRAVNVMLIRRVMESESRTLLQMVDGVDMTIRSVNEHAIELAEEPNLKLFAYAQTPFTSENRLVAFKVMRLLSPYFAYEPMIKGFCVFFPRSNSVINYSGMYTPELYYRINLKDASVPFERWKETLLAATQTTRYLSFVNSIAYVADLPIRPNARNFGQVDAVVCVLIDKQPLREKLASLLETGALYVTDSEGQALCEAGDTSRFPVPMGADDASADGVPELMLRGDTAVIRLASPKTLWQYTLVTSASELAGESIALQQWLNRIVLICLLVGLGCAIWFTYISYKPIGELRDAALEYRSSEGAPGRNELEDIRQSLAEVVSDNLQLHQSQAAVLQKYEHLQRFATRGQRMLRDGLILRIVRGEAETQETTRIWLETAGVAMEAKYSVIVLFYISDYSNFAPASSGADDAMLAMFAVQSVAEDMAQTIGQGWAMPTLNNMLLLLINTNREEADILFTIQSTQEFLQKKVHILASAGMGDPVTDLTELKNSYEQAQRALEYRFVAGKGKVIRAADIKTEAGDKAIHLSADRLKQMSAAVTRRDAALLDNMLDKTVREIKRLGPISMAQAQIFYYEIVSMVLRTMDELDSDFNSTFGEDFDPIAAFSACETFDEAVEKLREILSMACMSIPAAAKRTRLLVDQALTFMRENLHRPDFSQTFVADAVGVSPAYLSRIIKQKTHQNMVDVCNRMRVEKAREYLATTDLTLQEIAERVGLATDKSLIRIFKQVLGVTPGSLRGEAAAKEESSGEA